MTDACCQLHCHSSLSFKDGLPSEAGLVIRAKDLGQPGIGLTNHGHLYGAPRFFKACKEHNMKGVIGMEIYEAMPHVWDPDPAGPHHALFKGKWEEGKWRYFHLTLWAQDQTGWENLCAIHTKSFTQGFKPKNQPLVDRATLEQHSAGVIVGLGCPQSRTNRTLETQGYSAALAAAEWYFEVFPGRVYVEVMTATPDQMRMLTDQRNIAKHFGAETVGTNDIHYLVRSDGVLNGPHHMLVQARKHKSAATAEAETQDRSDDSFGDWYGSSDFYVKTRAEMIESGVFAREVDVGLEILDRVTFDFNGMPPPQPPVAHVPPPGENPAFDAWLAS